MKTTPTERESRRSLRATGGFSLAELVAVMTIVAILSAIAIPSLASLASTRSAAAAQEVALNLEWARQRAQTTGLRSWVVFDQAASAYVLLAEPDEAPGRGNANVLRDPATGREHRHVLAAGSAFIDMSLDAGTELGFDWLGRPLNSRGQPLGGQGVLVLTGGRRVLVEPESGLVSWQ
jgi:prepilin-type N-terminal cleavage/methylation domain-containing protein